MIKKDIETKIINFIEDFGCITEEQLKILFNCDKLILLFEDTEMADKIDIDIPYLYCTYPPVKII